MKEIPLTQGYIAIVDDEDCANVSMYSWRIHKNKNRNGEITHTYAASTKTDDGKPTTIFMHRLVCGDKSYGMQVIHIDDNGLNNQKENLIICTAKQRSQRNKKGVNTSSKYKGVCIDVHAPAKKYSAYINVGSKTVFLGRFSTEIEAAKEYDRFAIIHHREFARVNTYEAQDE